jgi:hypothetical protein
VTPEFLNMENLSEGEKILRGQEIKEFAKRDRLVRTNLKKAFTIIWAQCTPAMQSQIKGDREYETSKLSSDCVWLLARIKGIMMSFLQDSNGYVSMSEAKTKLYSFKQNNRSTDDYMKDFSLLVDIIEQHDGLIGGDPGLVTFEGDFDKELKAPTVP